MFGAKLGKKEARHDPRTLKLSNYVDLTAILPQVPVTVRWSDKGPVSPTYRPLLNTEIGCCAIAGPLHTTQTLRYADGDAFDPTDDMALEGYERIGGYQRGNPATDNGCVLDDVMNAWRRDGIGNHKIGGWGGIPPGNHSLMTAGLYLFGPLESGFRLPMAVQGAQQWAMPDRGQGGPEWEPGSWGGHEVPIVNISPDGLEVVSWGTIVPVEWEFVDAYCDEIKFTFSAALLGPDFKSPFGFGLSDLQKDMSAFG